MTIDWTRDFNGDDDAFEEPEESYFQADFEKQKVSRKTHHLRHILQKRKRNGRP